MTDLQIGPQILLESDNITQPYDPHYEHLLPIYAAVPLAFHVNGLRRFLCSTLEKVEAPLGMYGLVTLRSTWARLGLTAPPTVVDPGFSGNLTLEVFNSSTHPIVLRPTDKLFSIVWIVAADITTRYNGKYQGQIGVQPSKVLED